MTMLRPEEPASGSPWSRRADPVGVWPPVVTGLLLLAFYVPMAAQRSAWSDDYPKLVESSSQKLLSDLRPLGALINTVMFGLVDAIGGLVILRLVGVLGVAVFAGALVRYLLSLGVRQVPATLVGLTVGLLPPFYEAAGWATVYKMGWLPALGGWSVLSFMSGREEGRRSLVIVGLVGMVATFLVYPPAAFWGWGLLGIRVALRPVPVRQICREAVEVGCLLIGSAAAASAVALTVSRVLAVQVDSRVSLVSSPNEAIEKFSWFVRYPIGVASRPFQISSPTDLEAVLTGGPVLLVMVLGLIFGQKRGLVSRMVIPALLLLFLVLTMGTHLVVMENQIEWRFMIGLTTTLWVYLVVAVDRMITVGWVRARVRWRPASFTGPPVWLMPLLLLAVLFGAARQAASTVDEVFVQPFQAKERILLEELERFDPAVHDRIVVIDDPSLWPSRQRLGIYSTVSDLAHPWVVDPNLRLLLGEMGHEADHLEIVVVAPGGASDVDGLTLDLRPHARWFRDQVPAADLRRPCWPGC